MCSISYGFDRPSRLSFQKKNIVSTSALLTRPQDTASYQTQGYAELLMSCEVPNHSSHANDPPVQYEVYYKWVTRLLPSRAIEFRVS